MSRFTRASKVKASNTVPFPLPHPFNTQLIRDCNNNVQRMRRTEELIYLSQKIEFECKVSESRNLTRHLLTESRVAHPTPVSDLISSLLCPVSGLPKCLLHSP